MNTNLLGKSIKKNREHYRITQERLAEYLDVTTHYIYELEKGMKIPSLTMLIKLAETFHTTIDSLLSEQDSSILNNKCDKLDSLINNLSFEKRCRLYNILCDLIPHLKL